MSQIPQPLDKHDENADLITTDQPYARSAGTSIGTGLPKDENAPIITGQPDAHPAGTSMGNGLAKTAIDVHSITGQPDAQSVGTGTGNGLAKAAIGAVVGAVVGTLAGALANKRTTESINHTAKGVGDAVKGAVEGVNHTVKRAVDAVNKQESKTAHKGQGMNLSPAPEYRNTPASLVEGVPEDVKPSEDQSFKVYEERLVADKKQVKIGEVVIGKHVETQTAYISVPLKKEQVVVERITFVDAGTPVAPGEANFHEGEIARMEAYEETADIHKQAFVREEVRVRKEVEQDTVEVEDKIRREELDIDIQGSNVIDKTATL